MGSQFVDLNADGHVDYLTATFDGSPHVAMGGVDGFAKPEHLKDKNGERLLITSIWDYEQESHVELGRAMGTDDPEEERCISALAYDWDGDGDHDLLLGSYENGHLYRQMNEGSDAKPLYTGHNVAVLAGDVPFALKAKMTAPVLVDWDGDGDRDLVAGSFGSGYGEDAKGGGVYLSLNEGREGSPQFGALVCLVEPSVGVAVAPVCPNTGLYPAVVDWDGDGNLDLLVGGYSHWEPKSRTLNAEEESRAAVLRREIHAASAAVDAIYERVGKESEAAVEGLDAKSDEYKAKSREIYESARPEIKAASARKNELQAKLDELVPRHQRASFVWLYERQ